MALEPNVQTVVPKSVHKALRDEAYRKEIPLKDLLRNILCDFAATVAPLTEDESRNQKDSD